jgi:hypothetical protein
MIDPGNTRMLEELRRLGVRQLPVLRFLPRRHPINRWLGRMRRQRAPMLASEARSA